jgi:hypothetical protein
MAKVCLNALRVVLHQTGAPDILNADPRSQITCFDQSGRL